jgi:hypothetical protein
VWIRANKLLNTPSSSLASQTPEPEGKGKTVQCNEALILKFNIIA